MTAECDYILCRRHPTDPGRAARGLNDATFGRRMRGTGAIADQIQQTFAVFARKLSLDRKGPPLDTTQFQPPTSSSGQLCLF